MGFNELYPINSDISDSTFNNNSSYFGSAVHIGYSESSTFSNNTFSSNDATLGTVSIENTTVSLSNENFIENIAMYGGGYYILGSGVTASDISFDSNTASSSSSSIDGYGGAIYIGEIYSTQAVSQSTWTNVQAFANQAKFGGAVMVASGIHNFVDSEFFKQ